MNARVRRQNHFPVSVLRRKVAAALLIGERERAVTPQNREKIKTSLERENCRPGSEYWCIVRCEGRGETGYLPINTLSVDNLEWTI